MILLSIHVRIGMIKKWLEHAHIMVHSPWIDDHERDYWRDKIKELT